MKRKFAGIAALGMALTLAFGMTVSAAPSVTTSGASQDDLDAVFEEQITVNKAPEVTLANGTKVTVELEVKPVEVAKQAIVEEAVNGGTAVSAITETLKQANPNTTVEIGKVLVGVSVTAPADLSEEVLAAGVPVSIQHEQIENGKTYMVAHLDDAGNIKDYLGPVTAENGTITVLFHSFSSAIPIEVTVTTVGEEVPEEPGDSQGEGDTDTDTDPDPDTAEQNESSAPVSPKTGEVLPVAGFMAVICLVGAVICVKKAHN